MHSLPCFRVLFVSDQNTERSLLAEHLLRSKTHGRFHVSSAGLHPSRQASDVASYILRERYDVPDVKARSHSWEEFKEEEFDFIITLSNAARDLPFRWRGQPVRAHWGSPTPDEIAVTPEGRSQALIDIASQIAARVTYFASFADNRLVSAAWEAGQRFTFRQDYSAIDDEHVEWALPQLRACGY